MAPTICSEKEPQTRSIVTTNIRRHGQGTHQLNHTLSNIVNFVARGSVNPKVAASLRIQARNQTERNFNTTANYRSTNNEDGLNYNPLTHTSATSASNHLRQQLPFLSDNSATSSRQSDTENALNLRLAKEILSTDSAATDTSNDSSLLPSSLSDPTSLSSHREKTPSPTLQCQERLYQGHSTVMQAMATTDHEVDESGSDGDSGSGSGSEETDVYENDNNKLNVNKKICELHASKKRKYYFSCNDLDSDDEEELESTRELNSDTSVVSSDTDMETDDTDSMTSLDTEKSAELKRGNHHLLTDKLVVKQLNSNSSNTKSLSNTRDTDGLLSIAIKTIKLVKRNQLLQERLTQLQLETSEFIQSVLSNPENRQFRENIKQKV